MFLSNYKAVKEKRNSTLSINKASGNLIELAYIYFFFCLQTEKERGYGITRPIERLHKWVLFLVGKGLQGLLVFSSSEFILYICLRNGYDLSYLTAILIIVFCGYCAPCRIKRE